MTEAITYLCGGYRIEKHRGMYHIFDRHGNLTLQPPFKKLGEARMVIKDLMNPIDETMGAA